MMDPAVGLATTFGMQAILSIFDEFVFHRKRSLPRWERFGHPVDTLSLALCVFFALNVDPSPSSEWIFVALCAFSCLVVTKDEWIHSRLATPAESWVHALLFLLHPVVCHEMYRAWVSKSSSKLLSFILLGLVAYAAYQWIYWNLLRGEPEDVSPNQSDVL